MSIQVNLKKFKATHGTPAHPEHNLSASPNTWKPVTEEMWAPSIRAFPNPGGQHMPLFFTKTMIFGMLQINKISLPRSQNIGINYYMLQILHWYTFLTDSNK